MKAISLHQPWASFIAIGVKPFETRDWSPPRWLIGTRIAIHAAKKAVDADDREWAARCGVTDIPLGAVVCTAVLAGAYRCGPVRARTPLGPLIALTSATAGSADRTHDLFEDEFGDYSDGRWAWWLTEIERVEPPIPARGAQKIWNWNAPSDPA